MEVLVAGGYGFLGQKIIYDLSIAGYRVTVAGRRAPDTVIAGAAGHLMADLAVPGAWQEAVKNYDVIINLVGVNIFQRWNIEIKKAIYDSRIMSTRNLVDAVKKAGGKRKILINASAVGIYGDGGDVELDEKSPHGEDYLSEVCRDWEREAMMGSEYGMRVAVLRFGTVFGKSGGAFPELKKKFGLLMGAKLGNGKQWFPWVHVDDVSSIIIKIIKNSKMEGVYNCVSPGIVTNDIFTDIMSEEIHRPVLIPLVPPFLLRIIFGEFGGYLIKGQKAVPSRLLQEGYRFKYSDVRRAVQDLLK